MARTARAQRRQKRGHSDAELGASDTRWRAHADGSGKFDATDRWLSSRRGDGRSCSASREVGGAAWSVVLKPKLPDWRRRAREPRPVQIHVTLRVASRLFCLCRRTESDGVCRQRPQLWISGTGWCVTTRSRVRLRASGPSHLGDRETLWTTGRHTRRRDRDHGPQATSGAPRYMMSRD